MAGIFVTLVLDSTHGMNPSRKLVLVALADHANEQDGGCAYPSKATLSLRVGICARQVQEHLRGLEESGHIAREDNGRGGRGRATTYRLNIAAMVRSLPPEKAAVHCRVLWKIPGALPLGFSVDNPAASTRNPAVETHKPSSAAHETRQPAAPEPELNRNSLNRNLEPARPRDARSGADLAASGLRLVTKVLKAEPETTPRHLTREEQIEAARRLAQQELAAKKN
jgi:hypothetical protein